MNTNLVKSPQEGISINEESFTYLDPYLTQIGFFSVEDQGKVRALSKKLTVKLRGNSFRIELNALDKYDLPRTPDLDKYLAFVKILHTQIRRREKLENPIPLLSQDLLREIKYKPRYSNNEYESVRDWLGRLRSTEVVCKNLGGTNPDDLTLMTSVFHKVVLRGDRFGGEIQKTNLIWMDDVLLNKFNELELMPFDYEGYKLLTKPTAKTLVPLLSKWLFSSRMRERFEKNYDDLSDLLGNVKNHQLSLIKRQMFPGLQELQDHAWIESFAIEPNKEDGFKVCIKPGERFKKILNYQENKKSMTVIPGNQYHLPSSTDQTATNLRLVGAGESAKQAIGKSKYLYEQWLEYARAQSTLTNPIGFADKAYQTGEKDHILELFLSDKAKQAELDSGLSKDELKSVTRFCPQCYGSGREIVPGKGARECHHTGLTLERLREACEEGDLNEDLMRRFIIQKDTNQR